MPGGSGAWSEIVLGRQREALERKLALGGEKASDQPTHEQAAAPTTASLDSNERGKVAVDEVASSRGAPEQRESSNLSGVFHLIWLHL